jgi:hypothetical protein
VEKWKSGKVEKWKSWKSGKVSLHFEGIMTARTETSMKARRTRFGSACGDHAASAADLTGDWEFAVKILNE